MISPSNKTYRFALDAEIMDPDSVFGCGQCFRWDRLRDGSYEGIAFGSLIHVEESGGRLEVSGTGGPEKEARCRLYFDLERDYGAIRERLSGDPVLKKAVRYAPGIRILRQEPWEALCSFIISQNNNIPRIRGIISRLCALCGEPLGKGFAFPPPEKVGRLSEEDLAAIGCGYRSGYVLDAARRAARGEIRYPLIETLPLGEARAELLKIKGVGPKVADCALLFGFGRMDAFPVDVWVKRVLTRFYPAGFPDSLRVYGGVAQQFLFHYARCCPESGLCRA